jgi:hypothetical protein
MVTTKAPRVEKMEDQELRHVREALAESIDVFGLRATARELKMSPTGLSNLVDGTVPYGKTIRRVRAWYAQWHQRHGQPDVADEMALRVLVATVPEERRAAAVEQLAELLGKLRRGD